MSSKIITQGADIQGMREALEQLKQDLARFEALLPSPPTHVPGPNEDIFAEMAHVTAHAPHADDSREAIYTRMPGE